MFECFVNGSNSALTVTWEWNKMKYNSRNIVNTNHVNGVSSSLTINRAAVNDSGKYRCKATNIDEKSAESGEAELISNCL